MPARTVGCKNMVSDYQKSESDHDTQTPPLLLAAVMALIHTSTNLFSEIHESVTMSRKSYHDLLSKASCCMDNGVISLLNCTKAVKHTCKFLSVSLLWLEAQCSIDQHCMQ
jgi:hypothetical protein